MCDNISVGLSHQSRMQGVSLRMAFEGELCLGFTGLGIRKSIPEKRRNMNKDMEAKIHRVRGLERRSLDGV